MRLTEGPQQVSTNKIWRLKILPNVNWSLKSKSFVFLSEVLLNAVVAEFLIAKKQKTLLLMHWIWDTESERIAQKAGEAGLENGENQKLCVTTPGN